MDRYRFGDSTEDRGERNQPDTARFDRGHVVLHSKGRCRYPGGIVWSDLAKNAATGEEVKPVGEKGFVTFKQITPSPEGTYRVNMSFNQPQSQAWENLGTHDFRVGSKI